MGGRRGSERGGNVGAANEALNQEEHEWCTKWSVHVTRGAQKEHTPHPLCASGLRSARGVATIGCSLFACGHGGCA